MHRTRNASTNGRRFFGGKKTGSYLLLYLQGIKQTVIIPRDSIVEGDFDQFADYCSAHIGVVNAEAVDAAGSAQIGEFEQG